MTISGTELIRIERSRQVTSENYKPARDVGRADALVSAATAYSINALTLLVEGVEVYSAEVPVAPWPWDEKHWKPSGDVVRDLTKAGALIAAAIDTLIAEDLAAVQLEPSAGMTR